MLTLIGMLTPPGTGGQPGRALHAATAAGLFVVLLFWLVASRSALSGMRDRDRVWQESIDSMDLGIALYGPDDRLLNCNPAFRTLYPEIGELMQPGVLYLDLMHEYYRPGARGSDRWPHARASFWRMPIGDAAATRSPRPFGMPGADGC